MYAHPDEPITVEDLCRALGVSRRTLQYSFQEVLQTNPVNYLRVLRLNGARRMLRSGHPGARSVQDVAAYWGFWYLGHFATYYRQLFDELPSQTRECLAIEVGKSLWNQDVILTLSRLMRLYGKPAFIRPDNCTEFTSTAVMKWLQDQSVDPAYSKPRSPWKNGFVESVNRKLRDDCLNREWFLTRREANFVIEKWRQLYNNELEPED